MKGKFLSLFNHQNTPSNILCVEMVKSLKFAFVSYELNYFNYILQIFIL